MKHFIKYLIRYISLMFLSISLVQGSELQTKRIQNPVISNGIHIGDILNRTIEIEVNNKLHLMKNSLPLKGDSRNGVEYRSIDIQLSKRGEISVYKIVLSYQIFTNAPRPIILSLPAERLSFSDGIKLLTVDVPSWKFWFSPLVSENIQNARENLQPQEKPSYLDIRIHLLSFWLSIAFVFLSLLGFVYVNADRSWLPWMGGPFAVAHRKIKKLNNIHSNRIRACLYIHHAFNKILGESVFQANLDKFIISHSKFSKILPEINAFFNLSNLILFAGQYESDPNVMQDLIAFSKKLRDCERGV